MAGASADGWSTIEESLASHELPPVPPSSDPERLLRYALNIVPKYTEMEMMATHLRLYSAALEQDLEQANQHTRFLGSEVETEREKRLFLERYAAQLVKERNDLLHPRASKKTKTMNHFTWHSCCKKSGCLDQDLTPSINAFRGEKLQQAIADLRSLKEEMRSQERLRHEVTTMLRKSQREHDCKSVSDRKHIQALEKQLIQRAALQSNLERKLYDVESALARFDQIKNKDINSLKETISKHSARIATLEDNLSGCQDKLASVEAENDELRNALINTNKLKDELDKQVYTLSQQLDAADADMESMRAEIEVLESSDLVTVKTMYTKKISQLQEEWSLREQELMRQIDGLRRELLTGAAKETSYASSVHGVGQDFGSTVDPIRQSHWLKGNADDGTEVRGSSLSRSQLSSSCSSESRAIERHPEAAPAVSSEQLRSEEMHFPSAASWSDSPSPTTSVGCDAIAAYTATGSRDTLYKQENSQVNKQERMFPDRVEANRRQDVLKGMRALLQQFKGRRRQEESNARLAEQALMDFQNDQMCRVPAASTLM